MGIYQKIMHKKQTTSIKKPIACTGKPLFNVNVLGGHVEDYIGDPVHPQYFPPKMEWEHVKKSA